MDPLRADQRLPTRVFERAQSWGLMASKRAPRRSHQVPWTGYAVTARLPLCHVLRQFSVFGVASEPDGT